MSLIDWSDPGEMLGLLIEYVADEMVAASVVLEVVVSPEPGHVREAAARTKPCCPAHPGHHDVGPERCDFPAERAPAGQIENAAEAAGIKTVVGMCMRVEHRRAQ